MPDISFVSGLVETIYGFSPTEIESIQRYTFDWRGIFHVREANGQRWILRLLKHPEAYQNFHSTAVFLDWLNQQDYPAPHIRRTRNQELVGLRDDWTMLLLSFIDGEVITPQPVSLRGLSERLGQLHHLDHRSVPVTRLSRCHPDNIANHTLPQLRAGSRSAPTEYVSLFKTLGNSMNAVLKMQSLSLCITHGDCWYMNAVKTHSNQVVLIDWDNVGIGAALLDLGYLLLSSHFRLDAPFSVEPDQNKIQAIMEGYRGYFHLNRGEIRCLLPAVHFLLAFQLAEYYKQNAPLQENDPFLRKIQGRFHHATTVAQMAETYMEKQRKD